MENILLTARVENERRSGSLPQTPLPANPKKRLHTSVTNLSSQKRRRMSATSVDLGRRHGEDSIAAPTRPTSSTVDRFLSNRPKTFLPLSITPRTRRISQKFGLVDDKVLTFRDDAGPSSRSRDEDTLGLLHRSASSLFEKITPSHPTSVSENLNKRKDCLAVLDCPGVSSDPDSFPISWSSRNLIAVVCGLEIFYQNNDTKSVSLLGRAGNSALNAIQWGGEGHENSLAGGDKIGQVRLWDVRPSGLVDGVVRIWSRPASDAIKSCNWYRGILAVGAESGELSLIDTRTPGILSKVNTHSSPLVGLQWSHDGHFIATGDKNGVVQIWDYRAAKTLLETSETVTKLRHRGSARALSWCSWKPNLLATGTTAPEGKIRIWNTSSSNNSEASTPVATIPLNTSITSLQWSPHCKELLSTHGPSFTPILRARNQNTPELTSKLKYTKTPLANSITVHQYPSCQRLMTLSNAHTSAVSHSCLSPNGENIYTLCPREETIKLWKVWNSPKPAGRKSSAFDKFSIR
ncbi:WD40-repeat-containing domain protein [Crepidotus variabilis]|uniref:WD40-repeat-containing domain protein n=1 Tax=Crepidotus variabilis TaxID=179855 RepID=A0A9P6JR29_9AGAR|nr:WD40-repeat-containing domain protein [Crepidotus variabilis]